jgi:hypothetical protein
MRQYMMAVNIVQEFGYKVELAGRDGRLADHLLQAQALQAVLLASVGEQCRPIARRDVGVPADQGPLKPLVSSCLRG